MRVEHPLVERFRLELASFSAPQYAQCVQQFLNTTGIKDPLSVTVEQLDTYIYSKSGGIGTRRRHVSALRAFYRDLLSRREIGTDLVLHLSATNRNSENESLKNGLSRAGLSPSAIGRLTWRDILITAIGDVSPPVAIPNTEAGKPVIAALMAQLTRRLRADRRLQMENLLDQAIF